MTVLLITPDYASHYLPLVAVGKVWQSAGEDVVVATGPALRVRVRADGFMHEELLLADGGNSGLMHVGIRPREDLLENLRAARDGMIQMLTFQAERRLRDLFWNPEGVIDRLSQLHADIKPSVIISVELGYNATAALLALDLPFVSFVTGHPSEFPAEGELYGYPHTRPSRFIATSDELANLANLCRRIEKQFTAEFNRFVKSHNRRARTVANALAASSQELIVFNYPEGLAAQRPRKLPDCAAFVGSCVRAEHLTDELKSWLASCRPDQPVVYISLGSFFSIRSDVLARVVDALRFEPIRALLALGVTDAAQLGPIPDHWLAKEYFPQAAVLPHCHLVVSHGGNNTLTEALTSGVPLLVGPFSSDQFGSAADIEEFGLGSVFDPNSSSSEEIRVLARSAVLAQPSAARIATKLRAIPGAERVRSLCRERLCKNGTRWR